MSGSTAERRRGRSALRWAWLGGAPLAALLLAAPAAAQPVKVKPAPTNGAAEPSETRKEAARSMFKVSLEAFKGGRYQEALDGLQEVYKLDPNPIILYNIGRALEELGRLAEAADYFQQAVGDPALPEQLQAEVGRRLPKVLPVLKFRESRQVSSRTLELGIARGLDASRQEFKRLEDAKKPPVVAVEEPSLAKSPWFWAGTGSSVVGLGLLVGGLLVDQGLSDPIAELKDPGTRTSASRTKALQNEIEGDQLLATIFYISGGVLTAAGGVLLYFAVDGTFDSPPSSEGSALHLTPALLDGGAGVSLGGSF